MFESMEVGQANILIVQLVFLEIPVAIQFNQIVVVFNIFHSPSGDCNKFRTEIQTHAVKRNVLTSQVKQIRFIQNGSGFLTDKYLTCILERLPLQHGDGNIRPISRRRTYRNIITNRTFSNFSLRQIKYSPLCVLLVIQRASWLFL
jgi:hypothetical protein